MCALFLFLYYVKDPELNQLPMCLPSLTPNNGDGSYGYPQCCLILVGVPEVECSDMMLVIKVKKTSQREEHLTGGRITAETDTLTSFQ